MTQLITLMLAERYQGEEQAGYEMRSSRFGMENEWFSYLHEIAAAITINRALEMNTRKSKPNHQWKYTVIPYNGTMPKGSYDYSRQASRHHCKELERLLHHPILQSWCSSVAGNTLKQFDAREAMLDGHMPLEELMCEQHIKADE